MQKFARVENGAVVGFLELPDTIPVLVVDAAGNAVLDNEGGFQYVERPMKLEDALPESQASFYFPSGPDVQMGWVWDGSTFSAPAPGVTPEQLEAARQAAVVSVSRGAEQARLQYLAPSVGQVLTDAAKMGEVRRYDEDPNPVKTSYPMLSSEIGFTGASLAAVADVVREAGGTWETKMREIEAVRVEAVHALGKASTPAKLDAIVSALEWP